MTSLDLVPQKSLIKAITAIEQARLLLYPFVENEISNNNVSPKPGCKAEWDGQRKVLKFFFSDVLSPVFQRYEETSNHWLDMIARSFFINGMADKNIYFEHAFLLIIINYPTRSIWDVDSRNLKPLINGIRYLRILPDDNWKHLTYMVTGKLDQINASTELYVTEWNNMVSLLEQLDVKNWYAILKKGG